ncbi:MAG: hypothetical protein UR42_C0010G0009 [Candidatus Roizmanbacteria bacterium GW2011_GWA2_33_33]|uniref:Uncharacterized protein n=2 Tax=Candidatus Roizmaniibacteriota TaxID=1752723 RepID=A0A0G0AVB4_9BACT|nr:MAG: hypothetical protein UR42_C0010G0009 [Candidatus Roizmanbacteria bacterium GW2011_GWA2_33_33]KKP61103.1 MAG: hypothetical protein UR56_C0016G0014 [Candidatus Roizmanbacteria bacterium GW2011_GWC2_34_23]
MKKALALSERSESNGFTLTEVLVFVTILSLFFISAVTITTFSLRNLKVQEHKILATRYAEEGIEWVKQEKEDDWQVFTTHTGTNYCLNTLSWTSGLCSTYSLGTPAFLKRDLLITNSGSPVNRVTTNLTVSWLENGIEQKVVLKSVYNLWE